MGKKIIFIKHKKLYIYFFMFFLLPVNLFCMKNFENKKGQELNRRKYFRDLLIEIRYEDPVFLTFASVGKVFFLRYYEKENITKFIEFKSRPLLPFYPYNDEENLNVGSPEIKDSISSAPINIKDSVSSNNSKMKNSSPFGSPSSYLGKSLSQQFKELGESNRNSLNNNSLYCVEMRGSKRVNIIRKRDEAIVTMLESEGDIYAIGVTISFDRNSKKNHSVEYVLLVYSRYEKINNIFYNKCARLYCLDAKNRIIFSDKKMIFEEKICEEICGKICFYEIFKTEKCNLLILGYEKSVDLFNLDNGEKITCIKSDKNVEACTINDKGSFIVFSVNNILHLINCENKKFLCECAFSVKVIAILSYLKDLVFMSKNESDYAINFFDLKLKKIIATFEASFGDSFGIEEKLDKVKEKLDKVKEELKESEELYCWTRDLNKKKLNLYNMCEKSVKKVFEKEFRNKFYDFKIIEKKPENSGKPEKLGNNKRLVIIDFKKNSKNFEIDLDAVCDNN